MNFDVHRIPPPKSIISVKIIILLKKLMLVNVNKINVKVIIKRLKLGIILSTTTLISVSLPTL